MVFRPENRVIARFLDGSIVKGTTIDFSPTRDHFHVDDGREVKQVYFSSLKAVFFVKDFDGDADYREKKGFFADQAHGRKVMVEFMDGEVLFGYSLAYTSKGYGFFVFPGDPEGNNTKIFVVHEATRRVKARSFAGTPQREP